MNNQKDTTYSATQFSLFNSEEFKVSPQRYPKLWIEYAKPEERTSLQEPYKLVCKAKKYRLKKTFSFSIAIAIRDRSRGFDWTLTPDKKPRYWLKLKQVCEELIGDSTAWEVVPC